MGIKKRHKILAGVFLGVLILALFCRLFRSRTYDAVVGTNLIIVGDDSISLLGVRKNEDRLILVDLPDDLQVRVSGGEAFYRVGSLWNLGEIDNSSERMVKESLAENLGLWFQAVVKVKGRASIDSLLVKLVSLGRIKNLGLIDRYLLFRDISRLVSKRLVLNVDLPAQVFDEERDVDGKKWLRLNEVIFVWSEDLWPNDEILARGIKVKVINSSGIPGEARRKTRQLESVGFRVVEIVRADKKIENTCRVETKDKNDKLIKQIMGKQFGCKMIEGGDEINFITGKNR